VRIVRLLLAALDLVTVAGALEAISPGTARELVLVTVAVVGLVLLFLAAVILAGLLAQRQPPYPMT
jgi:hypothetical protein